MLGIKGIVCLFRPLNIGKGGGSRGRILVAFVLKQFFFPVKNGAWREDQRSQPICEENPQRA